MAKHDPDLSLLFHALADPSRRAMSAQGAAGVSELAGPTGLRLPTVMRHLSVLEEGGWSPAARRAGADLCDGARGAGADAELARRAAGGPEGRLDRLDDHVMKLMKERET